MVSLRLDSFWLIEFELGLDEALKETTGKEVSFKDILYEFYQNSFEEKN